MFTSSTQPYCRYCGQKIRKHTNSHWYLNARDGKRPLSKAECQTLTNEKVVSVAYNSDGTVYRFSSWDGKSYVDEFFCNGDCAKRFAYRMARKVMR